MDKGTPGHLGERVAFEEGRMTAQKPTVSLTPEEKQRLLQLAREALEHGVRGQELPPVDWEALPPRLREPGASFVTLYQGGNLRGCIGGLEPRWPLAEDVRVHAVAAALQDPRFPPVTPQELPDIEIEVSVLSPLQPLSYRTPEDLIRHLRPGVDGVLLEDPESGARATFLPQVWEKLPDPRAFLSHLALKAGLPPDAWLHRPLRIWTYQVEEFRGGHPSGSP